MLNYIHELNFRSRDSHSTVPTFDFYFKLKIPNPNKERIITERDRLGKILNSKISEVIV